MGKGETYSDPDATLIRDGIAHSHAGLHTGVGKSESHWTEEWYPLCLDTADESNCEASHWNTYGLRWGPDGFEMYLNGRIVNQAQSSEVPNYPAKDMYIVLNNGVSLSTVPLTARRGRTQWI